jgi:hypothetical protein
MFKQLRKLFTGHASSTLGMPMPYTPKLSPTEVTTFSHAGQGPAFQSSNLDASSAERFENSLLNWLRTDIGLKPVSCLGTNTRYWAFTYGMHEVHLAVIGQQHNTSAPTPNLDWILRIEEPEPLAFVAVMEQHFVASERLKRKMQGSGKTRVQFKSTEWLPHADLA